MRTDTLEGLIGPLWRWISHAALTLALVLMPLVPAHADLRAPTWYDQNAVVVAPDWHYRVPVAIPASATVNSTIKVDVDFNALLAAMGVSGTFDVNSPRIVRSTGALSTNQEFTDVVYAGATDAAGNARGEVRFILQDAGPATYYLYFDITANGAKAANPQVPINGNFEVGAAGTAAPAGWIAPTKSNANFDAQIRPSESPSITTDGTALTRTTDGTPFTGTSSYLLGARTNNEAATANPSVTLTRTIAVPASASGNLALRYRVEGWDSSANSSTNYDFLTIQIVGITTATLVGPTLANYVTLPFSPNLNASAQSATASGYGAYNGFDTDSTGAHHAGMTIASGSEPWFAVNASLAAFAGQTVTLRITTRNTTQYKTWFHIDDVEWSVVTGTLGTPEGFGVNITAPAAASTAVAGTTLTIRAQVDALATAAANPVTADIYNYAGTLVATGVRLYDDGTHGDTTAGDGIYSNNGSVGADPTYTIPVTTITSSGWIIRVFARDQSTSTIGAQNGLVHIPSAATPAVQANFYNIDEITFNVTGALPPSLTAVKSMQVTSDPVNGSTNPKAIPGGEILYSIHVSNNGAGPADSNSIAFTDAIPANTELFVGDLNGAGTGPVIYIDGTPTSGLTYTYTSLASATDALDFSNDSGVTWTYTPVPVAGYDALVTNIRVRPQGIFQPKVVTAPAFDIRFQVRVK
jgi:uncharacterized repeat protein (TIGR01451 family)